TIAEALPHSSSRAATARTIPLTKFLIFVLWSFCVSALCPDSGEGRTLPGIDIAEGCFVR
ncbi:MAG TPA: hypothetical protein PKW75_11595, partial [candidate division Zixibacteria bacterium]|nr:hypothetical protein [candidate division Zixibacteria bacterium]